MDEIAILKIGGNVLNSRNILEEVLKGFVRIPGRKILIHGGGRKADEICVKLGITPKMTGGCRITDEETLQVVTMVYAGLINKTIVADLQSYGGDAIGLTGADANIIPASKRPVATIDYGFAGDIEVSAIPTEKLAIMIENDLIPVVCSIPHDGEGQLLNTNADTIASSLAIALSNTYHVNLLYCFEKAGVLSDPQDDNSVIEQLDEKEYRDLIRNGSIVDGMIPKLDNSFRAVNRGVKTVTICGPDALKEMKIKGTVLC